MHKGGPTYFALVPRREVSFAHGAHMAHEAHGGHGAHGADGAHGPHGPTGPIGPSGPMVLQTNPPSDYIVEFVQRSEAHMAAGII